jgi:Uma2 family endonuclease
MPPCDVLIALRLLRTRQPDLLFMSNERLALNPPPSDPSPLSPAPELVVEILSPSDTRRVQSVKLADYAAVDVRECWLVSPEAETVEVLENTGGRWQTTATYGHGETVTSVTFPSLTVAVDGTFPASE